MNCIETAKKHIVEKGFKILDENDECLSFRYQMNNIHLYNNKEENFLFVSLTSFADVNDDNIVQVKDLCNKVNAEVKMVKMFVVRDIIIASAEIFSQSEADLLFQFDTALKLLVSAKVMYNDFSR